MRGFSVDIVDHDSAHQRPSALALLIAFAILSQGGMGVGVVDFDGDGWLDLVKTNFADDYPNLYPNNEGLLFKDICVRAGFASNPQFVGWGVEFVDLDNDG